MVHVLHIKKLKQKGNLKKLKYVMTLEFRMYQFVKLE